ncbi:LysR family transcriptional regulator, partial [Schumannella luteola]
DTEHLRSFIAVTETGSFTRAARREHLSQSTASAHIAALERRLGVTLLERRPDGTSISEAGERFLHRAVALVALTDETLGQFHTRADSMPTWEVTDFVINEFPREALSEIATGWWSAASPSPWASPMSWSTAPQPDRSMPSSA